MSQQGTFTPHFRDCLEYGHVRIGRDDILTPDGIPDIDPAVQRLNAFTVDFKAAEIRLQAGGFVGIVPINDRLVLRIKPRTPIANLTRMVERSGYEALTIDALRTYSASASVSDWLFDVYTDALIRHASEIVNSGFHRTYRQRHEAGSAPRGRINVSTTMQRFTSRRIEHKAHYTWFERTVDNAPNRCIKAALTIAHRGYIGERQDHSGSKRRTRQLSTLLQAFDEVSTDSERTYLSDSMVQRIADPPSSRSYYSEALEISVALIQDRGISLDVQGADITLPSMLLDMGELFEKYVRTTLQAYAADANWSVEVLDGNSEGHLPLYSSPTVLAEIGASALTPLAAGLANPPRVTPDIIFRRPDKSVPLIAELKNTLMTTLPSRAEVEQAVTYAVRYGTPAVLLVHPKMAQHAGGLQLCGRIGAVSVFDYRYDLAAEDMDAEDALFAESVNELLASILVTSRATSSG